VTHYDYNFFLFSVRLELAEDSESWHGSVLLQITHILQQMIFHDFNKWYFTPDGLYRCI